MLSYMSFSGAILSSLRRFSFAVVLVVHRIFAVVQISHCLYFRYIIYTRDVRKSKRKFHYDDNRKVRLMTNLSIDKPPEKRLFQREKAPLKDNSPKTIFVFLHCVVKTCRKLKLSRYSSYLLVLR